MRFPNIATFIDVYFLQVIVEVGVNMDLAARPVEEELRFV